MQISKKVAGAAIVVCVGLGAVIGSKWGSQIETRTVTKDKIVTVTREVKRPDGTVIKDETRTEDKRTNQVVVAPSKNDWIVKAGYGIAPVAYYGAGVYRRVIGDVYIGIDANTRGEAMVSVLVTF